MSRGSTDAWASADAAGMPGKRSIGLLAGGINAADHGQLQRPLCARTFPPGQPLTQCKLQVAAFGIARLFISHSPPAACARLRGLTDENLLMVV